MFQKFEQLSRIKKIGIGLLVGLALVTVVGANNPQKQTNLHASNAAQKSAVLGEHTSKPQQKTPIITKRTVTETSAIPFTATTVSSNSLAAGISKVTTIGTDGILTSTYVITYRDGVQISKDLIAQETTTQPVAQVTTVGTYVAPGPAPQVTCPNGTYINLAGNTVCNPYQSTSPPSGATAECQDGTYSFSQSHSGTCSHHGGVSVWL